MQAGDLPKQIVVKITNPNANGMIATWKDLVNKLGLPSIEQPFKTPHNKQSWKRSIKCLLDVEAYISMQQQCENYFLGNCAFPIGRLARTLDNHPPRHLYATCTCKNNYWIHLLAGCDKLEVDASCFQFKNNHFQFKNNHSQSNNPIYKLCHSEPKHQFHFIAKYPASHLSDPFSRVMSLQQENHTFLIWKLTHYSSRRSC